MHNVIMFNNKIFRLVAVLLLCICSLVVGGSWALYSLKKYGNSESFLRNNGAWQVNPSMDLVNLKQRAIIAKVGLFALRESEVIYYSARVDDKGRPLESQYDYVLEGSIPKARYWSYTLYGDDDFLIPNEHKIYSYNAQTIQYTPPSIENPEMESSGQATYKMTISSDERADNWLPSGDNNKSMTLILRMYNAEPQVYNNLETVPLPSIRRI